jgi:hypothetical protein
LSLHLFLFPDSRVTGFSARFTNFRLTVETCQPRI